MVTGTAHSLADMGPAGEAPAALATAARGAGSPRLVLVHGFTQTGRSWDPVAADLAVDHLVVDAPGHGGSGAVRLGLTDGARAIATAGGAGVYIGYSMGARYVLRAALACPEAVHGAVLLGANPGIEHAAERAARQASDEALAARLEAGGVVADRRRNTAEGLASSLRLAGTGAEPDAWAEVVRLAMPVLVLAGADDAKFAGIGERLATAIGANARFAVVPGAGHAAHLEQPAAFLAIVRAWLAGS